ncbi:MAG: glycosyltransferase [Verrucomicrobiaceae bacterium]
MKVLHIIPSVAPCRGGPSEAVLAMCRALKAQNVDAEILTTNDAGRETMPIATGQFITHEGVQVCFLPRWSPPVRVLREFQYSSHLSAWITEHAHQYSGLHVHAVFSHLPTRTMQLARRLGVSYIARPLGQLDPWSLAQQRSKKRLYLRLIELANLRGAKAIHCTSIGEEGNVRKLLPAARTEVIPHGIECVPGTGREPSELRTKFGIPAHHRVILFLSRWHPKKNIPLLLAALEKLAAEPWTLILAGQGDLAYEATILREIEARGLRQKVLCPGHVGGPDKAQLLHGADLFVLPSASENFGIAVAEALVCGLRCVVTQGVDLSPLIERLNAGTVCEASVASLASALHSEIPIAASTDGDLAERSRIQFSWHSSAKRLNELYGKVFLTPT